MEQNVAQTKDLRRVRAEAEELLNNDSGIRPQESEKKGMPD
jgi:hypothetical protein